MVTALPWRKLSCIPTSLPQASQSSNPDRQHSIIVSGSERRERSGPYIHLAHPEIITAIVARGDNLWRISHCTYGDRLRYTVIYGGNQDQIRDPNLIYPGRSFVLPPDKGQSPRG
jgi:nucleoid-associated protein YgaU